MAPNLQTVYKSNSKGTSCERAGRETPTGFAKCTSGKAWPQADGKPGVKVVDVAVPGYNTTGWGYFGKKHGNRGIGFDWVEDQLLRYTPPNGTGICHLEWPAPAKQT